MDFGLLNSVNIQHQYKQAQLINQGTLDFRWTSDTDGTLGNVAPSQKARIPTVNATWMELAVRMSHRFVIAPIIGYGQKAKLRTPVFSAQLETSNIPKVKHGASFDEKFLIEMMKLRSNLMRTMSDLDPNDPDYQFLVNMLFGMVKDLENGVRARKEWMAVQMMLGTMTYTAENEVGFVATYPKPAITKLVPSVLWGDGSPGISHAAASATPISDIWTLNQTLQTQYGAKPYNRMSIPFQGFQYILGTNEFKALAPAFQSYFFLPNTAIPYNNMGLMKSMVEKMIGSGGGGGTSDSPVDFTIEFDDRLYMNETDDLLAWNAPPASPATGQYSRYQPINYAILTVKENDGNARVWDIANAPVIETFPGMIPGIIGQPYTDPNGMFGPVSYATAGSLNADPPGQAVWAVQNCFPRMKDDLYSSASIQISA